MKTRLLKAVHYGVVILTWLIILSLSLFCLLWAEMPALNSQTPFIQSYLSKKLQHPVEMKSVTLDFQEFMPVLEIKDLVIYSPDHQKKLFALSEASLGFRYVYINNTSLRFIKNKDGKWEIENLSELIPQDSSSAISQKLIFEGDNISLNFIGVFPKPIIINNIYAKTNIQKTGEDFNIKIKRISAKNNDVDLSGKALMSNHNLNINLNYQLNSSAAKNISNYLPQNLLEPELLKWLETSVKSFGQSEGNFVLEGDPKDFPFKDNKGKFLVNMQLKNLNLQYDPEWPEVKNLNGELIFQDESMKVNINSANLADNPVKDIKVAIPVLDKTAVLNINGNINSEISKMLNFVNNSPLKKPIGDYFKDTNWKGNGKLQIGINIPLNKPSGTKVAGHLEIEKNSAKMSDQVVNNITGIIDFTENGLIGKNITAIMDKSPINIKISPSQYLINYKTWKITAVNKNNNSWQISLLNPKQVSGQLNYANNNLAGKLDYLYIQKGNDSKSSSTIKAQKIPALNIAINDFRYTDKQFGLVNIKTTPTSNGLTLDNLVSRLGNTVIQASGNWKNNSSGVKGSLVSHDTGETLKNWGLPGALDSQSATVNYQVNWNGGLYSPDLNTLQGTLQLNIAKGRIKHVGSQAKMDFGRLITLLSFQSLARRITFDFSDLTKKGLNFDNISGSFMFNNGAASTQNTVINGPIAKILITGSIDMVNQTYNLKLLVTPNLTSSLPIIATIAGGPIAGAAAWAANKLINPIVNKITSDTYTITGTWDNPVIK